MRVSVFVFIRKAWLKGLSPRENRTIPPILYDFVYRLKEEFPRLKVELNGDVKTMEDIRIHRQKVGEKPLGLALHQLNRTCSRFLRALMA